MRGSRCCNLRYADDVVLITKAAESLHQPVMRVAEASLD